MQQIGSDQANLTSAAQRVGSLLDIVEQIVDLVDDWQDITQSGRPYQSMLPFKRVSKTWYEACKHVSMWRFRFQKDNAEGPIRLLHKLQMADAISSQMSSRIRYMDIVAGFARESTLVALLSKCKQLEILKLVPLRILEASVGVLGGHVRLHTMYLAGEGFRRLCRASTPDMNPGPWSTHFEIGPSSTRLFRLPPKLRCLYLSDTDVCFSSLVEIPELHELHMDRCFLYTATEIDGEPDQRWFNHLNRVRIHATKAILTWGDRQVPIGDYPHLLSLLKNVKDLSLTATVAEEDLVWLAKLVHLEQLDVHTLDSSHGTSIAFPPNLQRLSIRAGCNDRIIFETLTRLQNNTYLPSLQAIPELFWGTLDSSGWERVDTWVRRLFEHHLLALRDSTAESLASRGLKRLKPKPYERSIWALQALSYDQILMGNAASMLPPAEETQGQENTVSTTLLHSLSRSLSESPFV